MANIVEHNFIEGAYVTIIGDEPANYNIVFIDTNTEQVLYSSTIPNNCWSKCTTEYFVNWRIEIYENGSLWKTLYYDATGKNVLISFNTTALGDTLAWIPYVEEFRKKHKCSVVVNTYYNYLLEKTYPEILFVNSPINFPSSSLYAKYNLGLFYKEDKFDTNKHPTDFRVLPLQKYASDILGIKYQEIKPKIYKNNTYDTSSTQVCLGIFSTKQQKFWNNHNEIEKLTSWITSRGYIVKSLANEANGYMNNYSPSKAIHMTELPLMDIIEEIAKSKLFIGLGSGLSWLSWGLGIPTVVISGFSYPYTEMQSCIRVTPPEGKCQGCFNRYKFQREDWYYCPDFKDSVRQFECTSSIKAEDIIPKISNILC